MCTVLFPDLPSFQVEQGIHMTARAAASSVCCPDYQQASARVYRQSRLNRGVHINKPEPICEEVVRYGQTHSGIEAEETSCCLSSVSQRGGGPFYLFGQGDGNILDFNG